LVGDLDTVEVGGNEVFVEGDEERAVAGLTDTLAEGALLFGFLEREEEGLKEIADKDSEVNDFVCEYS
jgi:hypothetical protein